MTNPVLVENRARTRYVQALGIKCDERERPDLVEPGPEPDRWMGLGSFEGPAVADSGSRAHQLVGLVRIAIRGDRLAAIVAPEQATAPAVWLAADLGALQVTTDGRIGVFKRRPMRIDIRCDGWELSIGHVQRLYLNANMSQHGQEASLLAALTQGSTG